MSTRNRFTSREIFTGEFPERGFDRGESGLPDFGNRGTTSLNGEAGQIPRTPPPFRILHVIPGLDPARGEASRAAVEIAAMSAADGMAPTVAFGAPEWSVSAVEREWTRRYPGVVFRGFPYSFPSRFEASAPLMTWLSGHSRDFDIMQAHSIYSLMSLQACSLAASAKLPYILRPLGSLDPYDLTKQSSVKYHVFAAWVERILKGASFVHFAARQEEANVDTFGVNPTRKILALPVSAPEWAGDRARFRRSMGIGRQDFVFLFGAQSDSKEGPELLLPAMIQAAVSHSDAHLVIAGLGEDAFATELKAWAAETSLADHIHFVSRASFTSGQAKADVFAGSDCFVLPSRFENFGMAAMEAMAYGLPALISDQVQMWQEIVEAHAGWVYNGSSQSLAAVMEGILNDRSQIAITASWARTLARKFEPQNLRSIYRAAYQAAAGRVAAENAE